MSAKAKHKELKKDTPKKKNTNEIINSTSVNSRNPQYGQDRYGRTIKRIISLEITLPI